MMFARQKLIIENIIIRDICKQLSSRHFSKPRERDFEKALKESILRVSLPDYQHNARILNELLSDFRFHLSWDDENCFRGKVWKKYRIQQHLAFSQENQYTSSQ